MFHQDRDGRPLAPGDSVLVPCTVFELADDDGPYNIALVTEEDVPISHTQKDRRLHRRQSKLSLHSRQVVKRDVRT